MTGRICHSAFSMYFLHTLKLSVWTLRCLHDRTQAKAMKQSARFHRHQNRAPSWRRVDGETGPKWPLRWQAWQTRRNMKMWYTFHISFYIIFLLLVTNFTIISINICIYIYIHILIHTWKHQVHSDTKEHCDWKRILRRSTASKCSKELSQTTRSLLQASRCEPPKPPQPGGGPAGGEAIHANPTQR